MVGVILAGGSGSRLGELTQVTNKHLLPVGLLPMVYYPIYKLVGAGIRDIMLITGTSHMGSFMELLGSGKKLGCNLTYRVQDAAGGIAEALALAEDFCGFEPCCVILGDNIFQDEIRVTDFEGGCTLYLKKVPDPGRFGVVTLNDMAEITDIVEKPTNPQSDLIVAGIYLYDPSVFRAIKKVQRSERGELEITDVNKILLKWRFVSYQMLTGYWTDAGTHESLARANELVRESAPRY